MLSLVATGSGIQLYLEAEHIAQAVRARKRQTCKEQVHVRALCQSEGKIPANETAAGQITARLAPLSCPRAMSTTNV